MSDCPGLLNDPDIVTGVKTLLVLVCIGVGLAIWRWLI